MPFNRPAHPGIYRRARTQEHCSGFPVNNVFTAMDKKTGRSEASRRCFRRNGGDSCVLPVSGSRVIQRFCMLPRSCREQGRTVRKSPGARLILYPEENAGTGVSGLPAGRRGRRTAGIRAAGQDIAVMRGARGRWRLHRAGPGRILPGGGKAIIPIPKTIS